MASLTDRFEIPSGVIAKQLAGETVILDLERGIYYGLNEVGSRMWQLLEEGKSLGEIRATVHDEYEVSQAEAERDLLHLVGDLQSSGLIAPA